jgi:hypothetical protein
MSLLGGLAGVHSPWHCRIIPLFKVVRTCPIGGKLRYFSLAICFSRTSTVKTAHPLPSGLGRGDAGEVIDNKRFRQFSVYAETFSKNLSVITLFMSHEQSWLTGFIKLPVEYYRRLLASREFSPSTAHVILSCCF